MYRFLCMECLSYFYVGTYTFHVKNDHHICRIYGLLSRTLAKPLRRSVSRARHIAWEICKHTNNTDNDEKDYVFIPLVKESPQPPGHRVGRPPPHALGFMRADISRVRFSPPSGRPMSSKYLYKRKMLPARRVPRIEIPSGQHLNQGPTAVIA